MTTGYTNLSQFCIGTETVSLYVTDSATVVSVENALFGALSRGQMQLLATLGIEGSGASVKLDAADLGASVPVRGSRIDRTDGTKWRVQAVDYSHVSAVYLCVCTQVIPS